MGCKSHNGKNCVCEALEAIQDAQEAIDMKCATSCFADLLNPAVKAGRDTVPFLLFDENGKLFKAFGGVGTDDCFETIVFRVENVKDCCATLSLLAEPDFDDIDEPCDIEKLVKTNFCIEVDLKCFCAIQCLSPDLVKARF